MSFQNKVVLITGASSGVGEAIALHFSTLSAKLVLIGRNIDNLNSVVSACIKNINDDALKPLSIVADVSKDEDVHRIIQSTRERFGRLDILVNNAGTGKFDNIETLDMGLYDEIMNTNLRAVFNLTHQAVPLLIESKGNIVNISSITGIKVSPALLTYSVSKAALNAFTAGIALHLATKKVRANSIVLGYATTRIQERANFVASSSSDFLKKAPLGEEVDLKDVAQLVEYLTSDAAKAITGHHVAIDGGLIST